MGFYIALAHYKQSVLVAHVVEHLVIGVVRGSYCVYVEVLHLDDVRFLKLGGHVSSRLGVVFMPVYALEYERFAV